MIKTIANSCNKFYTYRHKNPTTYQYNQTFNSSLCKLIFLGSLVMPVSGYAKNKTIDVEDLASDEVTVSAKVDDKGSAKLKTTTAVASVKKADNKKSVSKTQASKKKASKKKTSSKSNELDINNIMKTINQQHENASALVKSSRPPLKLSLSSNLLDGNYTIAKRKELTSNNDDILDRLTAVASTSVSNFKETGNAIVLAGSAFSDNTKVLSASHKSLPIGTKIKVTNKNNGKSVIVKISNRLSAANNNKVLSLSKNAASHIGILNKGIGKVLIERIR